MKESILAYTVDPLRELLGSRDMVIGRMKEESCLKFISMDCDLLPGEIFSAAGVIPLISEPGAEQDNCHELFDFTLRHDSGSAENAGSDLIFSPQTGWADYAYPLLRTGYESLLKKFTGAGFEGIDPDALRQSAREYNSMRREVRGIRATRNLNPLLLTNEDMFAVYRAALSLPPRISMPYLENISSLMKAEYPPAPGFKCRAIVSAGYISNASILDSFEEAGILAAEDHSCMGARMFDISYNADAPDLLAEIIYSFTFKLYCHAVRSVGERYDLMYRMLKGYGIDCAVIVTGGAHHSISESDADYLRRKLMRHGVDPVVCTWDNAPASVLYYAENCEASL